MCVQRDPLLAPKQPLPTREVERETRRGGSQLVLIDVLVRSLVTHGSRTEYHSPSCASWTDFGVGEDVPLCRKGTAGTWRYLRRDLDFAGSARVDSSGRNRANNRLLASDRSRMRFSPRSGHLLLTKRTFSVLISNIGTAESKRGARARLRRNQHCYISVPPVHDHGPSSS